MANSSIKSTPPLLPDPPPKPPDPPPCVPCTPMPSVDKPGLAILGTSDDDLGSNKGKSVIATMEPYSSPPMTVKGDELILFLDGLPLDMNFDLIHQNFSVYGCVREIRLGLTASYKQFQFWVVYENHKVALDAYMKSMGLYECSLVSHYPPNLDVYYPAKDIEYEQTTISRTPMPATWLIASTKGDRANLYSFRKLMRRKAGGIKNMQITRFGRNSFLIHAKSPAQGAMLANLKIPSDSILKEIKPHYNFSYAKGVLFNQDLSELPEEEILDMCPSQIWKVFKVPRSNMIILTFCNDELDTTIVIDKERLNVRPFRPRPLQCFNCFGYGHSSKVCTKEKICSYCSLREHGHCDNAKLCVNCKGDHHAADKSCTFYKREQEAVSKSHSDHISVGHAKKLLSKTKYSDIVKSTPNRNSVKLVPSRIDRLPASDLEIRKPSQSSHRNAAEPLPGASSRAPLEPSQASLEATRASLAAPEASLEASQSDSLPALGTTPEEGLICVPVSAQVHNPDIMDAESLRNPKRLRTPSPPQSHPSGARQRNSDISSGEPSGSENKTRKKLTDKPSSLKPNLKRGSDRNTSV